MLPAIAILLAIVGYLWASGGGTGPSSAPARSTLSATTPVSEPGERLVEVDGVPARAGGNLFVPSGNEQPQLDISGQLDQVTVAADDAFRIQLSNRWREWNIIASGVSLLVLESVSAGTTVRLHLSAANFRTRFLVGEDSSAVYSTNFDHLTPEVAVRARGVRGERFQVFIDRAGYLFIANEPIPPGTAINELTGERIGTEGLTQILSISSPLGVSNESAGTYCRDGQCSVAWTGSLVAEASGSALCDPSGDLIAAFGSTKLRIHQPAGAASSISCRDAPLAAFGPGDVIAPAARYEVSGYASTGASTSVVAGLDGRLYVGLVSFIEP